MTLQMVSNIECVLVSYQLITKISLTDMQIIFSSPFQLLDYFLMTLLLYMLPWASMLISNLLSKCRNLLSTPRDGGGQRTLVCCSPSGGKEPDTT